MDPDPTPRLRLILDHTTKNPDAATTATVWNPEDELHGHLELSSTEDLGIDGITIYFEGVSRNWINETNVRIHRVLKAERKFLSQAHDILRSNISRKDSSPGAFVFEAPFHFIISRAIPCTNPDSPEQCLQLPPSLNSGEEFVDQCTGMRFAQPRIIYFLRATVSFTTEDHQDCKSLETFLPITIAPYTEELPPTETDDFPMEFKERESKVLRRSLIGGTLGTMNVSLQEPPALVYKTSSTGSSTAALMTLEFQSTSTSSNDIPKSLQGLSFTVFSLVRVKTFYSVKSFPRLPSQTLLESFSEMRLRDGIIKLETQYVRDASWGYRFSLDSQTDASLASQLGLSISNKVASENGNGQVSMTSEPSGKWISNWTVPIEVNGRLLPSFCSSLVARFYTLIVRVKVAGARQERFDLEVPLQVIHTPPSNPDSPTVEPVRERFLEYRRASESSWFSDDSLESEQDPPQYYP
ncbi:uncharacterized protein BDZ99DRAFT_482461 [Mytilinidion resinicola]|uniref:Arrestin-like N-terminal domain-containing protein n=1 Tax=Mytilinidion resinicola TaxID=574789 RepID=A0A6A6Y258_9PEZI|nr:uncharacterized protein BDZ99DRAFT_482461 [Mytilinidion resinicola]KAF2802901.1 hypothetical protein BDZ99DRAFT_482461 [Mytilinidion resinicola]